MALSPTNNIIMFLVGEMVVTEMFPEFSVFSVRTRKILKVKSELYLLRAESAYGNHVTDFNVPLLSF